MVVKLLNNFSNAKPNGPHRFKEELKIKYDAVLAVVGKFLNSTGPMLELLAAEVLAVDWAGYCAMDVADQETREAKGDASTNTMLLLMNSKNNAAKKDLRLLYSQEKKTAYLVTAEEMARYLSAQYSNKVPNNPRNKSGDRNSKKDDDSKSEDSNTTTTGTTGAHVGEVTTPQDSTAPSEGTSIGAHISKISQPAFRTIGSTSR